MAYNKLIFVNLVFCFIILISGCAENSVSPDTTSVPPNMTYIGTKYVNCHINKDFPLSLENETSLKGTLEKPVVNIKHPLLNGVVIDDNALYNPLTRDQFNSYDDFSDAIGKKITVKGYYGETIREYNIFYVTDVPGWHYICCDATLEDTGIINSPNICFWFKR